MRRTTFIVALAMAMVLSTATVAFAGEVKGPPGPGGATGGDTPISSYRAASICSFSGLNDEITFDGEFPEPTQTQSYGTFLVLIKKSTGMSVQQVKQFLPSPGVACNPTSGFEE
jgi:hypothetical protein